MIEPVKPLDPAKYGGIIVRDAVGSLYCIPCHLHLRNKAGARGYFNDYHKVDWNYICLRCNHGSMKSASMARHLHREHHCLFILGETVKRISNLDPGLPGERDGPVPAVTGKHERVAAMKARGSVESARAEMARSPTSKNTNGGKVHGIHGKT